MNYCNYLYMKRTCACCRDPPSMQALNFLLVDDLLQGQNEGFPITDYSRAPGADGRQFSLRCVLLFLVGDYPGIGKLTNMVHAGYSACHWCKHSFTFHSTGHNVAMDNRRHLPQSHPLRDDARFGPPCLFEESPPPSKRTHAKTVNAAREVERLGGSEREKKVKATGVRGESLFALLKLFNIIADCLPDMMHILKNLWQRYFLPYFKGEVQPAVPQPPSATYTRKKQIRHYSPADQAERTRKYQEKLSVYNETMKVGALHFLLHDYCTIHHYSENSCMKCCSYTAIIRARCFDCSSHASILIGIARRYRLGG